MPRYFVPITEDELKQKIAEKVAGHAALESHIEKSCVFSAQNLFKRNSRESCYAMSWMKRLTPQIQKDLSKIEFDDENLYFTESQCQGDDCGIKTLDNGLTYLGAYGGGDWELPVYFIIYWDGKKLRGYIPTDGNVFNHYTKMAFGSGQDYEGDLPEGIDEEEDIDGYELNKRYGDPEAEPYFDMPKIVEDIKKRILKK